MATPVDVHPYQQRNAVWLQGIRSCRHPVATAPVSPSSLRFLHEALDHHKGVDMTQLPVVEGPLEGLLRTGCGSSPGQLGLDPVRGQERHQ